MITIFAAIEHVLVDQAIDKTIRTELYTTREVARSVIANWAFKESARGFQWGWSDSYQRWERWIGDSLHVFVVEEFTVHDEAQKEQTFDWTFDPLTITTVTEWPPKQSDCMHDNCPTCKGTGRDIYGGMCIHGIACPCSKCRITC